MKDVSLRPGEGALVVSVPAGVSPSHALAVLSTACDLLALVAPADPVRFSVAVVAPEVVESSGFAAWFSVFAGACVASGRSVSFDVTADAEGSCVQ
jgi:hypothetical protein